jgi:formylglycine-generating enzyme required for sulfatase activity
VFITTCVSAQNTDYVFVKGGKFFMGNNAIPDETPRHKVYVDDFYILNHEVTNAEFVNFLNEKGNRFEGNTVWIQLSGRWRNEKCRIYQKDSLFFVEKGYENYPVYFVSWWGAEAYAEWCGGRLPTEAEFEYLSQKLYDTIVFDSVNLDKYVVFKENSGYKPAKVMTKNSLLGIYDLLGNMSEWCYDWYSADYYSQSLRKNPQGAKIGKQKVKRGGSWATKFSSFSPTNRKASNPNNNNITIGFRVVIPVSNQ